MKMTMNNWFIKGIGEGTMCGHAIEKKNIIKF